VTALRTRVFPLIGQRVPLWTAALVVAVAGVVAHQYLIGASGRTAALIIIAAVVAVAAGVELAEHHRARLRRLGNLVEAIAVIALPVLLMGAFGVFSDLMGAFR
jgi:hypothetical protein